ncbi:MAG: phage minor capsid protein [Gemmatimonadota bacterium]
MAAFPSITREEARVVGRAFREEVDVLVAIWARAEARLRELATDPELVALAQGGPENITAARQRQAVLMVQTRQAIEEMRAASAAWAREAIASQALAGSNAAVASAVEQGLTAVGVLGVANVPTIESLLEDILIDVDQAVDSANRTMRRHFRLTQQRLITEAEINLSLAISESRLENLDQRSKRLQRQFAKATAGGAFVEVAGRRFRLETYAELVGRTRLAEAASGAAFATTQDMGIDLVRVSDHGPTDPICNAFAGKVFSASGRDSRFPVLRQKPPFHPNCLHVLLPYVAELKTDDELRFAIARSRDEVGVGVSIGEFLAAA